MKFAALLTWILWRFRPALWLDGVVARLIAWALALLEDEDHRDWLKENPANSAWFGGWLALGEIRLNELIHYRACELLNLGCKGRKPLGFVPVRSVRTLDQAILRFARLAERYSAIERLAQLRAIKLQRMLDPAVIELDPVRHPATPLLVVVVVVVVVMVVVVVVVVVAFSSAAVFSAQRIRAPPWPASSLGNKCPSDPQRSPARTRGHVWNPPPLHALLEQHLIRSGFFR